jgi:competence protein ComEC
MPLIYLCMAWLSGIIAGAFVDLPAWTMALSLPFFAAAFFLHNHRKNLIVAGLCLLALTGGVLRYRVTVQASDNMQLQFYNERTNVVVQGMVDSPPEIQGQSLAFRFSTSSIATDGKASAIKGSALVRLPFYKGLHYGDVLQLTGRLETPQQFDDFDYRGYLANQRIYTVINYPGVRILQTGAGFLPLAWIYAARDSLAESLSLCLPEPQGSLAQAILLGLRGGLPGPLVQSFYSTGTTHLIAISGLNLTIVLGTVLSLSTWLLGRRNRMYIWISLAFIWLYTILTGLPATMVRAAFMGSAFLLAELLGRQRNGITALALAAVIMLAIDPLVLRDISFQLSFLSMLGLVLIAPYLIKFTSPATEEGSKYTIWLRKAAIVSFGTTLAAILATWPITTLTFHSFSLVSLPATFFAMPAFPGIMVTSMLTAVAGLLWHPLGLISGWIAWLLLSYFLLIVNIFSAIPSATVSGINLQPWQIGAYYTGLALIIIAIFKRDFTKVAWETLLNSLRRMVSAAQQVSLQSHIYPAITVLLAANILAWAAICMLPDGKLHVSILDVGQGESILIRTPEGRNILVDAGPDPLSACSQIGRQLPFWDRSIDLLILTQLQSDHTAGATQLMKKYEVKSLALPPASSDSALNREIVKAAEEHHIKQIYLHAGEQIYLGRGLGAAVLNPPGKLFSGTDDDINNNSLVLRLSYNSVNFLLTADISADAEHYLVMNRADLRSTVLKVAHHGSRESSTPEFLNAAAPEAAVISVGAQNRFGHPAGEVLERVRLQTGNNVFTTAVNGTVEFISDGYRLWYRVERTAQ